MTDSLWSPCSRARSASGIVLSGPAKTLEGLVQKILAAFWNSEDPLQTHHWVGGHFIRIQTAIRFNFSARILPLNPCPWMLPFRWKRASGIKSSLLITPTKHFSISTVNPSPRGQESAHLLRLMRCKHQDCGLALQSNLPIRLMEPWMSSKRSTTPCHQQRCMTIM